MSDRNRPFFPSGGAPRLRQPPSRPAGRPSASTIRMSIAAAIIVALLVLLYTTAAFWVNWWWFDSLGYRSVLTTRYVAQVIFFALAGAGAAIFVWANLRYAARWQPAGGSPGGARVPFPAAVGASRRLLRLLRFGLLAVVFVGFGAAAASSWLTWLLFLRGRDFGLADPVFGHDAGFYVFALPALHSLRTGCLALVLLTALGTAATYAARIGLHRVNLRQVPARVRTHLLSLSALFLLLIAAGYPLANYELLYSTRGAVFGAGYTDVNVQRWANYAMAAATMAVAMLLLLDRFVRRPRWLLASAIAWVVLAVLLGAAVPAIVQQTVVEPSELRLERPFIADNIAMTRAAFALDGVESRELTGRGVPTSADILAEPETWANVRLWDYRVIESTFQNINALARYYRFNDVDIDRYALEDGLRQVLVAAREFDFSGLPANAQASWVNRRLVYTHGYGVVVSPAGEVAVQGLPVYYVSGIPPDGTGPLAIQRPEIYFGEGPSDWVAVNTEEREHTGLQGVTESQPYAGAARGSLGLDSYLRRLIAAVHLRDRRVLLSGELTDEARILLRREILERARTVAPFLSYDRDPYIVVANGRLYWIIDAYTETDRFPDATRFQGLNYVRNSVKVIVDAYDGTITFYRTDEPDAIADAYADVFPDLFSPIADAPPTVAAHFRYPERLFDLQAEAFAAYHVTDPSDFYNGEDRWAAAEEQVGGETRRMEAYYVVSTLPGEQEPGSGLILPFTPVGRQNMTAWMSGRSEADGGLRLVAYRFPRQETVFGPQQIAARINQQPDISREITLLDQAGSQVILGNLLVTPVGDSVVYVQPLYVQATQTDNAPTELKYVIVATSERVVMRPTLADALSAVTAEAPVVAGAPQPPPDQSTDQAQTAAAGDGGTPAGDLGQQALAAFRRAEDALRAGDWAAYGREQENLEAILRQLAGETAPAATPEASATPAP